MIKNTFLFLDGFGSNRERNIWSQNISDWNEFIETRSIKGIADKKKKFFDRQIIKAGSALRNNDSEFFAKLLPQSEHWRLYDQFKDEAIFLDIEVSHCADGFITVIGLYDGYETKTMIEGINLNFNYLKEELRKYKMIISFNGSVFDIPFINKKHPNIIPNIPHFDLRFCCSKLGITGSLKEIEESFGIKRRQIIKDLKGGDAFTLWRMWRATGDEYYLSLLIEYNEEDTINLKLIADKVFDKLKNNCKN